MMHLRAHSGADIEWTCVHCCYTGTSANRVQLLVDVFQSPNNSPEFTEPVCGHAIMSTSKKVGLKATETTSSIAQLSCEINCFLVVLEENTI